MYIPLFASYWMMTYNVWSVDGADLAMISPAKNFAAEGAVVGTVVVVPTDD